VLSWQVVFKLTAKADGKYYGANMCLDVVLHVHGAAHNDWQLCRHYLTAELRFDLVPCAFSAVYAILFRQLFCHKLTAHL
jgi:hypothetical protein